MKHHLLGTCLSPASLSRKLMPADIRSLNADAHFPEGPVWYHGKLYYVEYDRNSVTTWDGKKTTIFWSQKGCGPSAVIPTAHGEFLTTCYDSGTIGRISAEGKDLPPVPHDKDGNAFVGPNDLRPTAQGGIYFTCSGTAPGPAINGKVFYLAANGTITQKARDVHSANGVAVSKDGKVLYVVETEGHRLLEFNIGPARHSVRSTRVREPRRSHAQRRSYLPGWRQDRLERPDLHRPESPRRARARSPARSSCVNARGQSCCAG